MKGNVSHPDISPYPEITVVSPDLLTYSQMLHTSPHGNAEALPTNDPNQSSKAATDYGCAVKVEQTVESLSDPEKASPRRERIKKITGLFKSLKHPGGSTDTVPEAKELTRSVGESSYTVITIQPGKHSSDPKEASPKRDKIKLHILKNFKLPRGPDNLSVTTEQVTKPLNDPEEVSPKRKQKTASKQKKINIFEQFKKPKHISGTADALAEEIEMPRAATGSNVTTVVEPVSKVFTNSGMAKPIPMLRKSKERKRHQKSYAAPEAQVILDFKQNLEQNLLAEAGQQLLAWEDRLFSSEPTNQQVVRTESEVDRLKDNYDILLLRVWMVIHSSFNKKNQETLKSAVTAILQEEEQDRWWKETTEKEPPHWRPIECREMHDSALLEVVRKRIQQASVEEGSSDKLKREVEELNKLVQNDLIFVVREVQGCYTPEFDICNTYAQLYHRAFSAKLGQLPRLSIPIDDCIFILGQVSSYSIVLHQEELESLINSEALEPLLPKEDLKALEEQYLSHKEDEVKNWLSNVLKLEEEAWKNQPNFTDGYFCSLALDVIQILDTAMKQATSLLRSKKKAQRILYDLSDFLMSYKKSIEDLLKNQQNIAEILKAHLVSIRKLREYIEEKESLPNDLKAAWLSTAADLRHSCHSYFLSPIHDELKVNYSKLWTVDWFSDYPEITEELENKLNEKILPLMNLDSACLQELLSQLHFEVMIEYVRRMLKRKLKLKYKSEQEKAASFLCEDSTRINTLFIENGSDKVWLREILPRVSDVLKVQDSDALVLEICALLKDHPDLTEHQVCSILQLKTNVSCAEKRMIKECYHQSKTSIVDSEPAPPFFCRVPRSISLSFSSCFCIQPSFHLKGTLPCNAGCRSIDASSQV